MAESPTPFAEIDLGPSKLDLFLDKHQKKLILAAILLALAVIAYVIFSGIAKGKAEDAGAALLNAEKVEDYQELITNWPESNAAKTALPLIAELQGENSQKDAIETLKTFVADNVDHPASGTAKVALALRLLEEGNTGAASDLLIEVTEGESYTYIAPLAYITLGDISKAEGKNSEAEENYNKALETPNPFSALATTRLMLANATPPQKIHPKAPAAQTEAPQAATSPATTQAP